ncbi:hypothetical protein FB451DRAFT_1286634 [Mycena latifolia]|nr:hypothetical protein FB451DRAFT_1286634 [Mycena latifolia]
MAPRKLPQKLQPKRHHGYAVLLFILGTLFPPLGSYTFSAASITSVAARFGIGSDFWLNLLLTICGYIPGMRSITFFLGNTPNDHVQNIRNNKNHARTPKWAQRYGLVDTSEIKRKERKSQWQSRYNDRLPQGQDHGSSVDISSDGHAPPARTRTNGELWGPEDEQYYNADAAQSSSSGGRWHYPANFDDAAAPSKSSKKKKKDNTKKDRWARTEDAYSISEEQSQRKKSKKKKSKSSLYSGDSTTEFPEAAEGGLYGDHTSSADPRAPARTTTTDDVFNHEF